jgi:hypothetical protein
MTMGQNMGQRGGFRAGKRQFKAGIGVQQNIAKTYDLCDFFNALDDRLAAALPRPGNELRQRRYSEQQFQLNRSVDGDESDNWHITIAELRLTGAAAERQRLRWGKSDFGRVRGRIEDRICAVRSQLDLPLGSISLRMSSVERVGMPQRGGKGTGRKLAITPAPDDIATEYLHESFAVVKDIMQLDDKEVFVPHFTVCALSRELSVKEIGVAAHEIRAQLQEEPLAVELSDLQVFSYAFQRASIG